MDIELVYEIEKEQLFRKSSLSISDPAILGEQ